MKRKTLLQLIKTKSQEVEIKDLSQSILDKVRLLPQAEVITAPKKRFSYKPVFAMTLSVMTATLAFFIFYQPGSTQVPMIEDVNQVMAVSLVSAASLVDYTDETIADNDSVNMALGYFTLDVAEQPLIDNEIDTVSQYLGMMERLLNSDENFDYEFDTTDPNGFAHHLSFKTKDLLDQETNYTFNYNQINVAKDNLYTIEGSLIIGDQTYTITGQGDIKNPKIFQLRILSDEHNYIDIKYEISSLVNRYQINVTENDMLIQTANLAVKQENNQRSVYLDFVSGNATGSYMFQVENIIGQGKQMKISYYISKTTSESGQIEVQVDQTGADARYTITVEPKGREPFVVERGRGTNDTNGRPGKGGSGV